ncbi:reactive mitochondrial oxygen species modulator 1-domain-containing protein [Cristinia sonorae]|uniref:Reactive mitochondrial oxygen species modulator 1-domain-containing protein n=1 Tax=Cristinia sonorae TaxID=1940300 RepID=A0A8K0UH04_9AGAR|nr:reactive mitochondrial oxygen species modulator 1-domain-containing protein [Cristinia sonorae]
MSHRQPQPQLPTVWQKMKFVMGAMMGAGVGLTIGFIFGSYSILRGGAGPRGALPTLSQYMLSSGATFSFFLAIGSVIRNETAMQLPPHWEAARMEVINRSRPMAYQTLKQKWEMETRRNDKS